MYEKAVKPHGALLASLLWLIASIAIAEPLRITAEGVEADCAFSVLTFEIRGVPESQTVTLKSLPGGEAVPCQVLSRTASRVKIAWVATALKKDKQATWEIGLVPADTTAPAGVEVKPKGEDFEVFFGGRLFTRLNHDPAHRKPYFFPLMGPNGKMITRQFPMKEGVDGEDQDHPHQRSVWFTHGAVGGVDFWTEGARTGSIRKTRVDAVESGPVFGRIATRNEWVTPEGKTLLDDRRVLVFYPLERDQAFLDVFVTLTAEGHDIVFGDTKEGSFGVRLAESMKEARGGVVVTSRGTNGTMDAWGKPAEWVDYVGRVEGDTVGVAILDHPTSFRHPTHWHVRDYGLFAANPFGYQAFYKKAPGKDGTYKLKKGNSMSFRYRMYLHHGSVTEAKVEEVYNGFAKEPGLRLWLAKSP